CSTFRSRPGMSEWIWFLTCFVSLLRFGRALVASCLFATLRATLSEVLCALAELPEIVRLGDVADLLRHLRLVDLDPELRDLVLESLLARVDLLRHRPEDARQPAERVVALRDRREALGLERSGFDRARRVRHLRDRAQVFDLGVAEPLLLEARADSRAQQYRVEGLREIVVGAELDTPNDALGLVECREH